jgi:hypothetical protein
MRKCAAGLHAAGADAGFGIGQVGQQALAVFQEGAALVGERDAPRGAQQQLHAQAFFQRVDAPADHRRRHALGQRGGGQAALGGHRHEGFDLLEPVHGRRLCIKLKHESNTLSHLMPCSVAVRIQWRHETARRAVRRLRHLFDVYSVALLAEQLFPGQGERLACCGATSRSNTPAWCR